MNKDGTTLIELLVVMIVLTALLSVSVPAITSLNSPKQQIRKKAREVSQLLQTARLTAIKQNRPIDVVIDPVENRIIAQEAGYIAEVDSFGEEIIDTNRFTQSITLQDVIIAIPETNALWTAVRFTPFGSSDGGGIRIEKDGAALALVCDVLTGRPSAQKTARNSE